MRRNIMNERLYKFTSKMLNDDELSDKDKLALLNEWKRKTNKKIEATAMSSSELKSECEFLSYLSLRIDSIKPRS